MPSINSVLSAVAALSLAGAAFAGGGRVYVNAAATGANTGTSWQDAFTGLDPALQAATAGSEIWVAQGTYIPTQSITPFPRPTFSMRSGVALYGGFAGTETALAQRDPAAHPTILSGDRQRDDPANITDNTNPVVMNNGTDDTAILDGFTVRGGGGLIGATQPFADGGGFEFVNSHARIVNCIIVSNVLTSTSFNDPGGPYPGPRGGGAYISGGAPTFVRCTFTGNRAGPGIPGPCQGGSPRPGDMPGGSGGAVYIASSAPQFIGCSFLDNAAGNGGNGWSCTFNSSAGGNGGNGGAIYATASTPSFLNCTFARNTPGLGGNGTSSPAGPRPPGARGTGGAISMVNSQPQIIGCTITDNAGPAGVQLDGGVIRSSIIHDGAAPVITGAAAVAYSLVDPALAGPGNITGDPSFVNAPAGDFRLRRTSVCIDAGDSSAFPTGTITDAGGHPRFVDISVVADTGVGPAPIADMGAFEAQAGACPGDFNNSSLVTVQDVFDFLTAYFASDLRADINASGAVDTQDIYDFLAAYFADCP